MERICRYLFLEDGVRSALIERTIGIVLLLGDGVRSALIERTIGIVLLLGDGVRSALIERVTVGHVPGIGPATESHVRTTSKIKQNAASRQV
jgi:hypothetical protein